MLFLTTLIFSLQMVLCFKKSVLAMKCIWPSTNPEIRLRFFIVRNKRRILQFYAVAQCFVFLFSATRRLRSEEDLSRTADIVAV